MVLSSLQGYVNDIENYTEPVQQQYEILVTWFPSLQYNNNNITAIIPSKVLYWIPITSHGRP